MSNHKDIIEVMDKLGISNEPIPETAKAFLLAKKDVNRELQKIGDRLLINYNTAINPRLSKGVKKLIIKSLWQRI